MNKCEVLVLNGSPGAGKSTMANAIAELLRESDIANAIIDVDQLARVYPERYMDMMWDNLALIWKNYKQVPGIKVILPVCIDDEAAFAALKKAVPCDSFTVCELTAPIDILKTRVTEREPNTYWQDKLVKLVDIYENRPIKFADFRVDTNTLTPAKAALNIVEYLGWVS